MKLQINAMLAAAESASGSESNKSTEYKDRLQICAQVNTYLDATRKRQKAEKEKAEEATREW